MKKVLITGATGFVGKHLTDYLSSKNEFEIYGTSLSSDEKNEKIQIEKVDLTDYDSVLSLIEKTKPQEIYHLAALTSPAESFRDPTPVVLGNVGMEMNLLNAVREQGPMESRILVISSSEVYGMVSVGDLPIDEETAFQPVSPYAVSKLTQDYLARQYARSYNMNIVVARPFNHTGPGQSPAFVVPAFAQQIAKIEKGKQDPIMKVGNLEAKRDFSDVRDVVKAYHSVMEKGESGQAYNIGSGTSTSVREMLDELISYSNANIDVQKDPTRFLPVDIPEMRCDHAKVTNLTGWNPEIPLEQTLKDTLDYWRNIV